MAEHDQLLEGFWSSFELGRTIKLHQWAVFWVAEIGRSRSVHSLGDMAPFILRQLFRIWIHHDSSDGNGFQTLSLSLSDLVLIVKPSHWPFRTRPVINRCKHSARHPRTGKDPKLGWLTGVNVWRHIMSYIIPSTPCIPYMPTLNLQTTPM